jgi:HD superfamily phosphohydrolase
VSHEEISLAMMRFLNEHFEGKLDLAIEIFKGQHSKKFLTELISSQIDVDRLDYLKRDSFYSGVIEGQVNSERLIKMLNVKDNSLVIDAKGIYSVEKFIISRRLMYWQVYFHKTGLMLEKVLEKVLARAYELSQNGHPIILDDNLQYLFNHKMADLDQQALSVFAKMDDSDIIYHLKKWTKNDDFILSYLSDMLLNRAHLNKISIQKEPFKSNDIEQLKSRTLKQFPIEAKDIDYLVYHGQISHSAYNQKKHPIKLLDKNDQVIEFAKASDQLNIEALSHPVTKYYLSYPSLLIK